MALSSTLNYDQWIDEIVADLASGLIDASDEEIMAKLEEYGLSDEDKSDVLETIKQVKEAEGIADANLDPLSLENVDAIADAHAKQMANEDNTTVTVTSEDKDGDGDMDATTIEKVDSKVSDDDIKAMQDLLYGDDDSEDDSDDEDTYEGNSNESKDKPYDSMKNITNTLSQFKY